MRNRFYIPSSVSQRDDMPLWDLESLENETLKTVVPGALFVQHCDMLAQDNSLGYKKELDYIISSSSTASSINSLSSAGNTEYENKGKVVAGEIFQKIAINLFDRYLIDSIVLYSLNYQ